MLKFCPHTWLKAWLLEKVKLLRKLRNDRKSQPVSHRDWRNKWNVWLRRIYVIVLTCQLSCMTIGWCLECKCQMIRKPKKKKEQSKDEVCKLFLHQWWCKAVMDWPSLILSCFSYLGTLKHARNCIRNRKMTHQFFEIFHQ